MTLSVSVGRNVGMQRTSHSILKALSFTRAAFTWSCKTTSNKEAWAKVHPDRTTNAGFFSQSADNPFTKILRSIDGTDIGLFGERLAYNVDSEAIS